MSKVIKNIFINILGYDYKKLQNREECVNSTLYRH